MTRANHKCLVTRHGQTFVVLETCNVHHNQTSLAFHQARQAEQESGVLGAAVNVDTNGGNFNIPEVEEREVAATIAKLKTMLETGVVRFSAQNLATKVGKDC